MSIAKSVQMTPRPNIKNAWTLENNSFKLIFSKSVPMLGTISAELNINTVGRLNSLVATYTYVWGVVNGPCV